MTWAEAGAAGTGVETATRALDLLGIQDDTTLLVDGAAGGVHKLTSAAALAGQGRFRVPVRAAYPAHRAAQAHETAAQPPRWGGGPDPYRLDRDRHD
ncbi:hypothetical protein AB0G15_34455 [Streptosporangium sp. NPDC023825]|uniref:hypothetical protein n=1 Tax=Streptosporangium sp. NPDC023825 TaxID=3154909 RepID=UPI00341BE58E